MFEFVRFRRADAIKELKSGTHAQRKEMMKELALMVQLRHANIVPLRFACFDHHVLYAARPSHFPGGQAGCGELMIMEKAERGSLSDAVTGREIEVESAAIKLVALWRSEQRRKSRQPLPLPLPPAEQLLEHHREAAGKIIIGE